MQAAMIVGCSSLAVQEVGDARQLIDAVGSKHDTPETLRAVEVLVESALSGLANADYRTTLPPKQRAILTLRVSLPIQAMQ